MTEGQMGKMKDGNMDRHKGKSNRPTDPFDLRMFDWSVDAVIDGYKVLTELVKGFQSRHSPGRKPASCVRTHKRDHDKTGW
jgi:hypothetical protein